MAVVLETTLGDITIDLYINERPKACLNFLKLCRVKYYNFNLFHTVNQGFIAQTGDPTGSRIGGESIWGVMEGPLKRYFEAENSPRIKHTSTGLVSFVGDKENMIGSQFFITLAPDLTYLDSQHCVFGEVSEGFEILRLLNEAICDGDHRPYQDIRITHTVVLEDPFPDPEGLRIPDSSPEPTAERLQGGRIAPDEEIDETEGKSAQEVHEIIAEKEAKARATILEMIGDIPDAEMAPPENVLFVCKLNPVTSDDDLEIIFSRFGKIKSCEVIRDKKSGDSLQYAFVEFEEQKSCEDAYFKMDNVLIDDRRIHVDFSQSVAKIKWHGKGRGVTHYNEKGEKEMQDSKNDLGNGRYKRNRNGNEKNNRDRPERKENRYKEEERSQQNYDYKRNQSRREYNRYEIEENDYRRREYNRSKEYERRRQRSNSRERGRYKNQEIEYRRTKGQKYRSRSRENERKLENYSRKRQTYKSPEKENKKKLKYQDSSEEEKRQKKKDFDDSEKPKKSKKKKSKKKKHKSDSSDDSSSEEEKRRIKKKKKKAEKYSDSSESDVPKKTKRR